MDELKEHSAYLRDVKLWYSTNAASVGITTEVFFETQSTKTLRIVDETSSDPGISSVIPIPVDADHLSICKCATREDLVYASVRKFVASRLSADYLPTPSQPPRKLVVHIDTVGAARQGGIDFVAEVARTAFPDSDAEYPKGSFVRRSASSIAFVINKPTVALRASIEFMRAWHRLVLQGEPDCRVAIDYAIDDRRSISSALSTADALELLPTPGIYLTEAVVDACDPTLASFRPHCSISGPPKTSTYRADFSDPRTVGDSSLVHALFIAQPGADEARERLLELFMAEYLLEHDKITLFGDLLVWMGDKGYWKTTDWK